MKKALARSALTGVACIFASVSGTQAMTITPFDTAADFAAALVGAGITISNVTYTGATAASGYFSGGVAAGIGMESGIVLTSGHASNLNGTANTDKFITGDNQLEGSAILMQLIPTMLLPPDYLVAVSTYDATILSFDFVFGADGIQGGDASFNFVFGSEEYNEYVNTQYNDVYGFFLDGTAVGDNVALIPGTTTPISIDTVNLKQNSDYYNDNQKKAFPFEYNGFTDVITIVMKGLSPGKHTMTIAIADTGDRILDSGVFIQGESFVETPVPEPATMLLMGAGLAGLLGAGRRRKA